MHLLSFLYAVLIGPLELFFEVLYAIAYQLIGDPGIAIIFLSLAMNFLVLPLYRRADAMQEEQRAQAIKMKPWTDHIKRTFKGDERFMMLQTYNRQCGHKPTDALKGSVSLLLEIPFFIAAYHFLSNLSLLRGVPFGPIADLGAPDALLVLGGISVNVLPILMTAINLASAIVYMKGLPLANKVQMYGIAAIFLVLLYNSPAGLVFYWTLNNVFSLVKNIFYRLKNPGFVLSVIVSVAGVVLFAYAVLLCPLDIGTVVALAIGGVALQVPLVWRLAKKRGARLPAVPEATPASGRAFLLCGLFLALLTGALIPLAVVQSSPTEFAWAAGGESPLWYVAHTLGLALGTFVVWFGVFYWLMSPRGKTVFCCLMLALAGVAVVDYLGFVPQMGNLSVDLQYGSQQQIDPLLATGNVLAALAVSAVLIAAYRFKGKAVTVAVACLCVATAAMSVAGAADVQQTLALEAAAEEELEAGEGAAGEGAAAQATGEGAAAQAAATTAAATAAAQAATTAQDTPHVALSKDGRNVVIIMMDRSVGYFIPYLLHEAPELKDKLAGFTYYPNTVSYGISTNFAAPALYGGYDYQPEALNARNHESLVKKHDEALKVMPRVFMQNGFEATFFDPTYAGYGWTPNLRVFNDMPDLHTYITMDGTWDTREGFKSNEEERGAMRERNFFCYSLFRVSPVLLQPLVYHDGDYNAASAMLGVQLTDGSSRSTGVDANFMSAYSVLQHLPEMTTIQEGSQDVLFIMSNDTTHEPAVLQEPEYIPSGGVNNTAYDAEHLLRYTDDGSYLEFPDEPGSKETSRLMHYEVNMAALRELCNWFDYLRENGVWDNTRIIVVSDHGRYLKQFPEMVGWYGEGDQQDELDLLGTNCLLMVKDFNSQEFTVNDSFMTNADTPALAMEGLINNPVNPYTGNPITTDGKNGDGVRVFFSFDWNTSHNNGKTFLPGYWFTVRDDVFDPDNWEYLGFY